MSSETTVELRGIEKASMLLVALGPAVASQVLKHLPPPDVQLLVSQVAKSKKRDPELEQQVIDEFEETKVTGSYAGGLDYAHDLLEKALGAEKAQEIMADISAGNERKPFDWLRTSAINRFATTLSNERPQVIAVVLAHLASDRAADVISQLPDGVQGDVAYRLTAMQPVDKATVKMIDNVLQARLCKDGGGYVAAVGGVQSLVNVLNNADRSTENAILGHLEKVQPLLAESVRQMMFVFEDIIKLDNRAIQATIRELEPEDLRMSLKGASDDIRQLFYRNMSERAAESLKEDIELMGSAKRRDVEAAQRRVVTAIRHLDETGEINLREDNEETIE